MSKILDKLNFPKLDAVDDEAASSDTGDLSITGNGNQTEKNEAENISMSAAMSALINEHKANGQPDVLDSAQFRAFRQSEPPSKESETGREEGLPKLFENLTNDRDNSSDNSSDDSAYEDEPDEKAAKPAIAMPKLFDGIGISEQDELEEPAEQDEQAERGKIEEEGKPAQVDEDELFAMIDELEAGNEEYRKHCDEMFSNERIVLIDPYNTRFNCAMAEIEIPFMPMEEKYKLH